MTLAAMAAKIIAVVLDAVAKLVGDAEGRPSAEVRKSILAELTQTDKDLSEAEKEEEDLRHS